MSDTGVVAILLAAGSSTRFGGDKLGAELGAGTVLSAAAKALAASEPERRAAVLGEASRQHAPLLEALGYDILINANASEGMGTTLSCGADWAKSRNADYLLVALADMPFVTPDHFSDLMQKARAEPEGLAYSLCSARRTAPACFSARWFGSLCALQGDAGARAIIHNAPQSGAVAAPSRMLADIDFPADLC